MNPARRINVLFVMMQMEMGGSERLVHNLAQSLDRARFSPSVAWFHGARILPEFRDLNVPLFHVPKRKRVDCSALRAIGRIITENKIDIVNAHHFMPFVYSFYGSKIENRAKLFYTEHSEWEIERLPWKWRAMGGWLLRHGDGAVGVSRPVADRIRKTFKTDPRKTTAILNGVRPAACLENGKREALRKELGIESRDRVIGIVANLKKVKNHFYLLKAFRALAQDHQYVKLLIVGQGFENDPDNTEPAIRQFITANGLGNKAVMTGYRADVPALLTIMDIFCLTSYQEGLPISLVEAMAAGMPLVGTDVDGIRDVIQHGRNGFLVRVDDTASLQNALRTLIEDQPRRAAMGRESKLLATNLYSLQHCITGYQELFQSVT